MYFFREKDDNDEHPQFLQCHDSWQPPGRGGFNKLKINQKRSTSPFCSLESHKYIPKVGLGKSAYKMIDKSELFSNFVRQKGKLPVSKDIQMCGTPLKNPGAREQLPKRDQRARAPHVLRLPLPPPPHVDTHPLPGHDLPWIWHQCGRVCWGKGDWSYQRKDRNLNSDSDHLTHF